MEKYDAIIIGAGVTGLMIGALLCKHGRKVLIIEKLPYVGGRAVTRTIRGWGWGKYPYRASYGPHILPARGHEERLLDDLGITKQLNLIKLATPVFRKGDESLVAPRSFFNPFELFRFYSRIRKAVPDGEIVALSRIALTAIALDEDELAERYERVSCTELLKEIGAETAASKQFIAGVIGGYCFNDDIDTCPALDLLINLKLFFKGVFGVGTLMYHVEGGYGRAIELLSKYVQRRKGKILLRCRDTKIESINEDSVSVSINDKWLSAKHLIFTGGPAEFKVLLKKGGLNTDFLKPYLKLSPAKVIDVMVLTDRRMHHENTTWLSMFAGDFGYVIIDEEPKEKPPFLYHICVISNNKKMSKAGLVRKMLMDLKRLGFDPKRNSLWHKQIELIGYSVEKNTKLPYSERTGPETPFENVYWVGDQKILTVGTDGCAHAAMSLVEKLLAEEDHKK